MLSVLVHYCTFSCFSQHIKCIKDQWNSATNKDSTTADRVDGWSTAREKFDPLCIMFLCVSACVHVQDSTHKAQRGGINSMLLRVEPGRHVRWNFFPQKSLIWLWFKAMCILSDISLWHKGSFFLVSTNSDIWVYEWLTMVTVHPFWKPEKWAGKMDVQVLLFNSESWIMLFKKQFCQPVKQTAINLWETGLLLNIYWGAVLRKFHKAIMSLVNEPTL